MALTLPDDLLQALHDLADALGKPAATVVAEILQDMQPQIVGLEKIARASKAGNQAAAKRALQHLVGDSLAEVVGHQQPELFGKRKGSK